MATLIARIDFEKKEAVFFGAGTFQAKDQIKSLGAARWLQREKVWQVKPFTLSIEELKQIIPNIQIETAEAAAVDSTAMVEVKADVKTELPPSNSVSELIARVRYALSEAFPGTVYVHGVLVNAKTYGDRIYLELADAERRDQRVHAVIWRDAAQVTQSLRDLGFELEADLQLMFEARMDVSPKDARVSLSVVRIVPEYTLAKLVALREMTNQRLKAEGIFEKNKQQQLPLLPRKLGILTSPGGTVIHDFRNALDEAEFGFELLWQPILVQGENAKASIVAGIKKLSGMQLDAILLFRGGGSPAELAVFSEYEVAKAICLCPLPVVSAIGHQADQSSAQDVSCFALGVPKDVGRFFADRVLELRQRVETASETLRNIVSNQLESTQELFSRILNALPQLMRSSFQRATERLRDLTRPIPVTAKHVTDLQRERLLNLQGRLIVSGERLCESQELRLAALEARVQEASPAVQLERGFALVRSADGSRYVRRGADVEVGEKVSIQFSDRERQALIEE